jgi:uncharacterized metal-binding protein YceD (DUF177 family)
VRKDIEYIINYEGLKTGKHQFDFNISDEFFENLAVTEFNQANIHVAVDLMKDPTMLVFQLHHKGTVHFSCDRCLDDYQQNISGDHKLIVNFGEEDFGDNDVMITLPRSEYEINLAPFISEYIILSLPMRHLCKNDVSGKKKCNHEMIEKINKLNAVSQESSEPDPRWEGLKKLIEEKDKNKK